MGLLKFEDYKSFFVFTYKPPEILELSDFQIVNLFNESLIKEDNVTTENIFSDFIDYSMILFKKNETYDFEFFLILYINIINRKDYFLINKIFELFDLNLIIKQNDNSSLLKYQKKLSNYYKFQIYVIEKIKHIIKQKISENNLEFYLIEFYTIYAYFLHILNLNDDLEEFLKNLRDNNEFDKLILPKLYLSKYSSFYRDIPISIEMKKTLINKFFYASNSFIDLENSFSLASEYLNKNFVNLLLVIRENYDKIYEICLKEKKVIEINSYIKQDDKDELSKIQEYLDFIFNKKKENNFEAIYFDINIFLYFIKQNSEFEFLSFIESKLFEVLITFEDIEDALIYSSTFKNKHFIPILKIIIKNIYKIKQICIKENKYIFFDNKYTKKSKDDNLITIKEFINTIVTKEKEAKYYTFIKFEIKIWEPYIENINLDLETLKLIKKIILICKEVDDDIDPESIGINTKIHEIGFQLIKNGELMGEKLINFLGEDEAYYNDERIKILNKENNNLKNEIRYLNNRIYRLSDENDNLKSKINSLKSDLSDLKYDMSKDIEILKKEINNLKSERKDND